MVFVLFAKYATSVLCHFFNFTQSYFSGLGSSNICFA